MSLKPLELKGVQLEWKAWKLPNDANPPEKPKGYGEEATLFMKKLLKETGLEIKRPSKKYDTFLAHTGGQYAKAKGKFSEYHNRIFKAIWENDEDIESVEVLSRIAGEIGLDPQKFKEALDNVEFKELVEKDFKSAEKDEVWTIPSYSGEKGAIQVHHFKDIPSVDKLSGII